VIWPAAWPLEQAARQACPERRWLARLDEPPSQLVEVLGARPPEVHLKPILADGVVTSRESRLYRFLREHYNDAGRSIWREAVRDLGARQRGSWERVLAGSEA
jgi:hypothetical protein